MNEQLEQQEVLLKSEEVPTFTDPEEPKRRIVIRLQREDGCSNTDRFVLGCIIFFVVIAIRVIIVLSH